MKSLGTFKILPPFSDITDLMAFYAAVLVGLPLSVPFMTIVILARVLTKAKARLSVLVVESKEMPLRLFVK